VSFVIFALLCNAMKFYTLSHSLNINAGSGGDNIFEVRFISETT
jgi:hypothetical protein